MTSSIRRRLSTPQFANLIIFSDQSIICQTGNKSKKGFFGQYIPWQLITWLVTDDIWKNYRQKKNSNQEGGKTIKARESHGQKFTIPLKRVGEGTFFLLKNRLRYCTDYFKYDFIWLRFENKATGNLYLLVCQQSIWCYVWQTKHCYQIQDTLSRFPESRLGDEKQRKKYYDEKRQAYVFVKWVHTGRTIKWNIARDLYGSARSAGELWGNSTICRDTTWAQTGHIH
jgi:hypothetical protein